MPFLTRFVCMFFVSIGLAHGAAAEEAIEDRDRWLEQSTAYIAAGDVDAIEASLGTTLGSNMLEDVKAICAPLRKNLEGREALYIDKIKHIEMGQTFDQHIYAAYYGEREFVYFAFTFAKLENGWQLYALDYADRLARLSPIAE